MACSLARLGTRAKVDGLGLSEEARRPKRAGSFSIWPRTSQSETTRLTVLEASFSFEIMRLHQTTKHFDHDSFPISFYSYFYQPNKTLGVVLIFQRVIFIFLLLDSSLKIKYVKKIFEYTIAI